MEHKRKVQFYGKNDCRRILIANRQYDNQVIPNMLVEESFDRIFFRDVVEAIFATDKRDEAEAVIEEFSRFWMSIIGTRGATGKKTVNASTQYANLFEEV